MRLVVDVAAWDDLSHIGAWIAKDNPKAARTILDKILRTIEHLHAFPRLSRPGRARNTLERVVAGTPYIVAFEIWEERLMLVITAVAHGARNR